MEIKMSLRTAVAISAVLLSGAYAASLVIDAVNEDRSVKPEAPADLRPGVSESSTRDLKRYELVKTVELTPHIRINRYLDLHKAPLAALEDRDEVVGIWRGEIVDIDFSGNVHAALGSIEMDTGDSALFVVRSGRAYVTSNVPGR